MKTQLYLIIALLTVTLVSFKSPVKKETIQKKSIATIFGDVDGKAIFNANGCSACHNFTQKTVGPSVIAIAKAYKNQEKELLNFLDGKNKAIIDPPQFPIMKPQLAVIKNLSKKEKEALVQYMLSAK